MATILLDEPTTSTAPKRESDTSPKTALQARWLPPLVLAGAVVASVFLYAYFWQNSRHLWWWSVHDRHAHYMYGLELAMDLRSGDLARVWHDFDRIRVWGPFHVFMVALVELVGGPDHRLAVLPSLVGWIMTTWFAFLIPRRMLSSGGNAAGLIAACMVAVSPAHRAFATDVMYESLGAGLSLAALYCYLVVVQDRIPRWGIALGVVLSVLFLHKYNYWFLVAGALMFAEFARQPKAWGQFARSLCQPDCLPRWLLAELKQPLNYLALAFAGAAVAVVLSGGRTLSLAGREISFQGPHNFIHLAYLAFFARLCLWWWKAGSAWSRELPINVREVLLWHGGAIALWFALPKRLSYFLWYLSPANTDQHRDSLPFMHGWPYYVQALQDDYLTLPFGICLFAGMLLLGVLCLTRLRAGSAALFLFLLLATYLTCQHPMLKNRFMHSWIAAGWIIGAVGLVQGVQQLAGLLSPRGGPWAAGIVCSMMLMAHAPWFLENGHAQEGGIRFDYPTATVIPETYLSQIKDADRPTLFCNVPVRFLLSWTFIEECRHQRFNADIKNYKATFENNPESIRRWLAATPSDTLVVIDIHPGSPFECRTDEYVDLASLEQVLRDQQAFTMDQQWDSPEGFTVWLWKKKSS